MMMWNPVDCHARPISPSSIDVHNISMYQVFIIAVVQWSIYIELNKDGGKSPAVPRLGSILQTFRVSVSSRQWLVGRPT